LENKSLNKNTLKKYFFILKSVGKVAGGGQSWAAEGDGRRQVAATGGWRWLDVAAGLNKRLGLRLVLRAL
jgi:hypothetical protein